MRKVKIHGIYKHFKGNYYLVEEIAKNSETLEDMVIYTHNNEYWARPLSMFLDKEDVSKRPDNVTHQKYRFEKLKEEKL